MDAQTKEMFELILQGMEKMEHGLRQEIADTQNSLHQEITQVKVLIENQVTQRIDALFDGYKLTHEKQWEMERKMQELESRLERLEAKAG